MRGAWFLSMTIRQGSRIPESCKGTDLVSSGFSERALEVWCFLEIIATSSMTIPFLSDIGSPA